MKSKKTQKHASLRNEEKRILAQGEYISNNTFETECNNNDLIIGPTGSGKTRYYVKPNLLNASESLVVTDTKGNLHKELTPALEEAGYEVLHLDLTNPKESIGYNPVDYIPYDEESGTYDQNEIASFAETLYGNATSTREPYWDEAGKALLRSVISTTVEMTENKEHNTRTIRKLFELVKANGKGGEKSRYWHLMESLRREDPDNYGAAQYDYAFSESVESTANCIRMITGNKLSYFLTREIDELLSKEDRIDILQLAQKKTALFVTISDMDRSQDMLANLFYTQAISTLCRYADKECEDYCLPIPVRFILDDFATNACIPNFDNLISVIRSRGIAVSIILQSKTQLEKMYGEAAATTIMNGCDTVLYMGGQDLGTAHYIGTRVNRTDFTVLTMPLSHVWLMQRGKEPKLVNRYELTSHPRYKLLPEAAENKKSKVKSNNKKGSDGLER